MELSTRYRKLCLSASNRGIPNNLTENEYAKLVESNECHYCHQNLSSATGYQIDRKDNKSSYTVSNCVPCCTLCNLKKGSKLSYKEMMLLSTAGTLRPDLEEKTFNGIQVNVVDFDANSRIHPATPISLTFYKNEFVEKNNICLSIIAAKAGLVTHRLFARKLTIKEVPQSEHKDFLTVNHLKGYSAAPAVGLYGKDQLYMLLSYKKYAHGEVEIHRLATKRFHIVVGGFSKLLRHITDQLNPQRFFSFVDLRYHIGTGLTRLGFEAESKISKSWFWTDGKQIFNRLRCRANMDDRRLTQKEYAKELGWWQVYDAGQQKFIKVLDGKRQKHSNFNTETWDEMCKRLAGHNLNVITKYEDYKLLERHKAIEIKCNRNHIFYRTRFRLWSLRDCPDCKGLRRRSPFEEVIAHNGWHHLAGKYEDKNSRLTCVCPEGHKKIRQYRWFRDNKCPDCAYSNSAMLRRVSDALGGNPIERKRKVYEQILARCDQTNQVLNTTWEEFLAVKKTSATIPIQVTCKYNHMRSTIWQVLKEHGCGCPRCRKENKKRNNKLAAKPIIQIDNFQICDKDFKKGSKYGKLKVIEIIDTKNVICICECGETTVTAKDKLLKGRVKSCGCSQWDKVNRKPKKGKADSIPGVDEKLERMGYKRITGAVLNESSRVQIECLKCGHCREMNWSMIKGTCKKCYHIRQTKEAYKKVVDRATAHGYVVVDDFETYLYNCEHKTTTRNGLVKIKALCVRNHPFTITAHSAAKQKWRCIECIRLAKKL